jgi:hypothetical protein
LIPGQASIPRTKPSLFTVPDLRKQPVPVWYRNS